MIKKKTVSTALTVTLVFSFAGLAFPQSFDVSVPAVREPVIVAQSDDKSPSRHWWIAFTTNPYALGSAGDAELELACSTRFCGNRETASPQIFMGKALRELLKFELSHRYLLEVSRIGRNVSLHHRSTESGSSPVRNPLSIFSRVASKYGWAISDARMPSLPSGKDRGFGLGYGAGIKFGLPHTRGLAQSGSDIDTKL